MLVEPPVLPLLPPVSAGDPPPPPPAPFTVTVSELYAGTVKVPEEVKFWEPAETTAGNEKSNKEHTRPASRRERIVFTV